MYLPTELNSQNTIYIYFITKTSNIFYLEEKKVIFFIFELQNEAPTGVAYTSQNQSVAAFVAADKIAFYHCAFYSTHNTLFDYKGRHYYESCYIQGSIDFIFGRARSHFHVSFFFFWYIYFLVLTIGKIMQ
jgi:pectin methylesterase-like acyl-CoA thioesterase